MSDRNAYVEIQIIKRKVQTQKQQYPHDGERKVGDFAGKCPVSINAAGTRIDIVGTGFSVSRGD